MSGLWGNKLSALRAENLLLVSGGSSVWHEGQKDTVELGELKEVC